MRCRPKTPNPGDVLPVNESYHYPLPSGLGAGVMVKLISFDAGYWKVEADGQCFEVFMARIDSGWEYELHGCWLPADDPRVQARRYTETLAHSPAYSCDADGCVNPPV